MLPQEEPCLGTTLKDYGVDEVEGEGVKPQGRDKYEKSDIEIRIMA